MTLSWGRSGRADTPKDTKTKKDRTHYLYMGVIAAVIAEIGPTIVRDVPNAMATPAPMPSTSRMASAVWSVAISADMAAISSAISFS